MHFETIQIVIFMTSSCIIHCMSGTSVLPMSQTEEQVEPSANSRIVLNPLQSSVGFQKLKNARLKDCKREGNLE